MPDDDSQPWRLGHQGADWFSPESMCYRVEAVARLQEAHAERVAQRKRDREAAKRLAKGLPPDPTDYPGLLIPTGSIGRR